MVDEPDDQSPSEETNPYTQFAQPSPQEEANPYAKFAQSPQEEANPYAKFAQTPDEPSTAGSAIRGVLRGAIPTTASIIGGIAGAGVGGLTSPVTGPVGPIAGAIGGGYLAGEAARKAQESVTDTLGIDSPESRAADQAAHPYVTEAAELAPGAASLSTAGKLGARVAGGIFMGGVDVINQGMQKGFGNIDPTEALIAGGVGAAMPTAKKWANEAGTLGGRLGGEASARPVLPTDQGIQRVDNIGLGPDTDAALKTPGVNPAPGSDVNQGPGEQGATAQPAGASAEIGGQATAPPVRPTPEPPLAAANPDAMTQGDRVRQEMEARDNPEGLEEYQAPTKRFERQTVTPSDLEEINTGLAREGIEPVRQPAPNPETPNAPDTIRFYHGAYNDPTSGGSRWLTPDAKYARDYGEGERTVHYVDVPREEAERLGGYDEIGGRPQNFNAPEEIAQKLKPVSENFGGRGVDGQNENVGQASAAENEAIAKMKPPPPGEPHSLGADINTTSELPEAPPPLFSGAKWTPAEEVAQRSQEYGRVEKLKRAGEINDIVDRLKSAVGKGPWNFTQSMMGRSTGNMRAIHDALETDDLSKLTAQQREILDKSGLNDLLQESRDSFQKEIDAGRMTDRGQLTGLPRLTQKQWLKQTGESNEADPVMGDVSKRNLNTDFNFREPATYQLRDGKGNTMVVTDTEHGFRIWDKGTPTEVTNPTILEMGGKVDHDGKTWTVEKPSMDAVEQNVKDRDGDFVKYVRSPISIIDTVVKQRDLSRNMKLLDLIKADPAFKDFSAASDSQKAKDNGWIETKIPQLKGTSFDPEIATQLNSLHIPGMDIDLGKAGRAVSAINRYLTGSIFWNPVPHTLNTAAHWFVGRGGEWFNPARYPDFFTSSNHALREVLGNGPMYRQWLKDGAPLMWPSIEAGQMTNTIGRLGEVAIQQDPKSWNQIARGMGLTTGRDLVKLWYQGARQVLWQSGDIMAMQRVMELQMRGMSPHEAIQETRVHLPDYTIPYKVMGQPWLSQLMQDPRNILSVFNRYHMGVFKSLAKIAHDTAMPNVSHDDRMKAIGNALALVTLAYVIKPAMDYGWEKLTGNPNAEANPRGPLSPLSHIAKAIQGKESYTSALGSAFTLSPFLRGGIDAVTNKDWRGKSIIEPMSKFHQQLAQGIGHYGFDQIAPLKTFGGTLQPGSNKGSFGHELAAQLGDFKNPTAKQVAGKKKGEEFLKKDAKTRTKKPENLIEYGAKKLFGYAQGGPIKQPDKDKGRDMPADTEHGIWETSRGYENTPIDPQMEHKRDNSPNPDELRNLQYTLPSEEQDLAKGGPVKRFTRKPGYAEGGDVMAVKPTTPGQWSDEDEARLQATDASLQDATMSRGIKPILNQVKADSPLARGARYVAKAVGYDEGGPVEDDYDYQAAAAAGVKPDARDHLPDTFKKKNHMTFSKESQFSGQNGAEGGSWDPLPAPSDTPEEKKPWMFTPGKTNLEQHTPQEMGKYFQQVEPDSLLKLPNIASPDQGYKRGGAVKPIINTFKRINRNAV